MGRMREEPDPEDRDQLWAEVLWSIGLLGCVAGVIGILAALGGSFPSP